MRHGAELGRKIRVEDVKSGSRGRARSLERSSGTRAGPVARAAQGDSESRRHHAQGQHQQTDGPEDGNEKNPNKPGRHVLEVIQKRGCRQDQHKKSDRTIKDGADHETDNHLLPTFSGTHSQHGCPARQLGCDFPPTKLHLETIARIAAHAPQRRFFARLI